MVYSVTQSMTGWYLKTKVHLFLKLIGITWDVFLWFPNHAHKNISLVLVRNWQGKQDSLENQFE